MQLITNFSIELLRFYEAVVERYNAEHNKECLSIGKAYYGEKKIINEDARSLNGDITFKEYKKWIAENKACIKESLGYNKRVSYKKIR